MTVRPREMLSQGDREEGIPHSARERHFLQPIACGTTVDEFAARSPVVLTQDGADREIGNPDVVDLRMSVRGRVGS